MTCLLASLIGMGAIATGQDIAHACSVPEREPAVLTPQLFAAADDLDQLNRLGGELVKARRRFSGLSPNADDSPSIIGAYRLTTAAHGRNRRYPARNDYSAGVGAVQVFSEVWGETRTENLDPLARAADLSNPCGFLDEPVGLDQSEWVLVTDWPDAHIGPRFFVRFRGDDADFAREFTRLLGNSTRPRHNVRTINDAWADVFDLPNGMQYEEVERMDFAEFDNRAMLLIALVGAAGTALWLRRTLREPVSV